MGRVDKKKTSEIHACISIEQKNGPVIDVAITTSTLFEAFALVNKL